MCLFNLQLVVWPYATIGEGCILFALLFDKRNLLLFWLVWQAERDAFKSKGEELEEELKASKGREKAISATLEDTKDRLKVWFMFGGINCLLLLLLLFFMLTLL